MARTLKTDKILFWETIALVCVSLVMILSASGPNADIRHGDRYYFFLRQLPWVFIGVVGLFVMMRTDYQQLRRAEVVWPLLGVTFVALCAVFAFPPANGAQRWIRYGDLSAQPAELAKLAAVVFSAAILERRMHRINDLKFALGPIGIVVGALALLIGFQPDLGSPAVLVGAVFMMVMAAGLSWRYIGGVALLAAPLLAVAIYLVPYRLARVIDFLTGKGGYQTEQAMIALGSGGLSGLGLENGRQKLFFLPEPHNDFIFAVIGEEWGFLGTTALVIAFALIAWRGLRAAMLAPDRFGTLLGIGLVMLIVLQAFFNMSVVAGLVPPKGIPLPLVSAGGSSLLMTLVAIGILLNISQQGSVSRLATERTAPEAAHALG
jgi:cell division protein FtsW